MESPVLQEEIRREQEKLRGNATIYDILKLEHRDVKRLFKQIVDEENYQDHIYNQIRTALEIHMAGEEKYLYPRLENNAETRLLTLESYEEHEVNKKVINDIDDANTDEAKLAKIKVLNETVNIHVQQEEGELFKKAKRVISDEDEREIARQFMNEKMEKLP